MGSGMIGPVDKLIRVCTSCRHLSVDSGNKGRANTTKIDNYSTITTARVTIENFRENFLRTFTNFDRGMSNLNIHTMGVLVSRICTEVNG
jgi:hypothetical protein